MLHDRKSNEPSARHQKPVLGVYSTNATPGLPWPCIISPAQKRQDTLARASDACILPGPRNPMVGKEKEITLRGKNKRQINE